MKSFFSGTSTVEVMVILVAMALVISVSYAAKSSFLEAYREIVHRERAQLYALETFEQLESLRLTRQQQNYQKSWTAFLGQLNDGSYHILQNDVSHEFILVPEVMASDDDVREYFEDGETRQNSAGFYSRLERRIFLESVDTQVASKKVLVSIFWGLPGSYTDDHVQQLRMEALYSDQTGPAFVL